MGYAGVLIPPIPVPLTAPQSFIATDGAYYDKITLSWANGAEPNANRTHIYRDDSLHAVVPFGDTDYIDTAVLGGTTYTYRAAFANKDSQEGPPTPDESGSTAVENIYVKIAGDTMTGTLNAPELVDNGNRVHTAATFGSWQLVGTTLDITIA
jgi:hypothetical protein